MASKATQPRRAWIRHKVQIEITETAIFDDAERAARVLRLLQEAGYRVAPTISHRLFEPVQYQEFLADIKIDKSFIDGLGDRHSAAIVSSIINT